MAETQGRFATYLAADEISKNVLLEVSSDESEFEEEQWCNYMFHDVCRNNIYFHSTLKESTRLFNKVLSCMILEKKRSVHEELQVGWVYINSNIN